MTSLLTGQLILRTDKRNPLFTVYADAEGDQERLHVHYGLELLEVVSADRNDPSFETLVGRLHNAGVSLRVLQQTFQSDAKTIQPKRSSESVWSVRQRLGMVGDASTNRPRSSSPSG